MIFLIAVAALFTLIVVVLLAAYLVSGHVLRPRVSYTVLPKRLQVQRKYGTSTVQLTLLAQVWPAQRVEQLCISLMLPCLDCV